MPDSTQQILKEAQIAVAKLKEKQFRTLAILLSILAFVAVAHQYFRVLAQGIGHPVELIGSSLSYLLILISLFPEKVLSFSVRKYVLAISGFIASFSAMIVVGSSGSGYILFVLDAFIVHYFFEKTKATVIIVGMLILMTMVSVLSIFHVLPPSPAMDSTLSHGYLISKIFVVMLTIVSCHFMNIRSTDIMQSSITESLVSREKLCIEQRTTNEYLESIPGLFFLFDENWQLERWNQNLSLYSQYSMEELQGKDVLSFFGSEEKARVRQKISDVFVKGRAYAEAELLAKDGGIHPFAFTSRSVKIDGRTMACGIGIDLSEKRHLEKEVMEAQKKEALGTLAGGVAHDLNNVLAGIIGYAEIAKMSIKDGVIPKPDYIETILLSCQRGAALVRQILLFARRAEEKQIQFQIYPIVRDAVNLIRYTVSKSIEIRECILPDNTAILGNPNQLHQVIMNVCANGIHAMRERGGNLTVSVESVDMAKEHIPVKYSAVPGLYQKVVITDTGTGISPIEMETIFQPFFTTKPAGEGTGLGLAVVEKIVKKHNGFIIIKSEVNKGTAFSLYFPVHNQYVLSATKADIVSLPHGTEQILVVEDEPTIREASKIYLERLGYKVFSAENGEEGLMLFKKYRDTICLVISNFSMPRKDGIQMAKDILRMRSNIPILLITGYAETTEAQHDLQDSPVVIMNKPVQGTELAQTIRHILDNVVGHFS